ncbi:hypothetical protein ACFY0G_06025 [Streptomyces sp. NPDC001552]|uniref:hypothetical protein n=1 Tax=Streptomyces sp. NPDC001552 TaxID=3364587 RepID=UPI0036986229
MRNTRRTSLRSAAVVVGAATVLALPVGSAFADSPAVPGSEVLPSVEPVASVRAYVTTVKLADGSVAKVYKIGDSHYEADVFAGATKLDTLVSKAGAASSYGQNNGLHVVLRPNGTVTSWMAGAPKPQIGKGSSVRIAMPDGRIAELVDGPHGKRVEISTPKGRALATIDLRRPSVHHDGWTYRVVQDGERVKFVVIDGKGGGNGWVYDFNGRLIAKYTVEPAGRGTGKDVKAVAPGGGAAAADAAGLRFAVLRGQG